jgi:hypothetical protein
VDDLDDSAVGPPPFEADRVSAKATVGRQADAPRADGLCHVGSREGHELGVGATKLDLVVYAGNQFDRDQAALPPQMGRFDG